MPVTHEEGDRYPLRPPIRGSVAEWSKAAVLKTDGCNRSVGSNPTASAKQFAPLVKW